MTMSAHFSGFSKETFKFLSDLERNNSREWFQERRDQFDEYVLDPSQRFVVDMGERLKTITPGVVADPRTDKSIFRIYRDTRFSADKAPYKTHIGIFFWEGSRKKLGNSGFYLQLNKSSLFMGAGIYNLPRDMFKTFRDSVVDGKKGRELQKILDGIQKNKLYKIGGEHYKRVPPGYNPSHPNAAFLLHNGLYAYTENSLPDEISSSGFVDYCFDIFRDLSPLHVWLVKIAR